MESNQRQSDDSELDRLLGQAQWRAPRAEQLARLTARWRTIARRRRMRLGYGVLAAAASLLTAAGILQWRDVAVRPKTTVIADRKPVDNRVAEKSRDVATARAAGAKPFVSSTAPRDPNLYERVLLMSAAADHDRHHRPRATPRPAGPPLEEMLEELVVALAKDADAEPAEPLARVQQDPLRCERLLWEIISHASAERRLGAARVLGRIGTQQSLPILIELTNDSATRAAVMPALGRWASVGDLARLASVEADAALRRGLLTSLLERRTDESIGIYLGFVNHQRTRADALGAVADMADPPADLLLAFLENSQKSARLAAAQALARLRDPQIARRLSGSVLEGIGRQEALVALLLSRSAQADGLLNEARQDLYLVAAVQAAEQELHSLTARGGNLP